MPCGSWAVSTSRICQVTWSRQSPRRRSTLLRHGSRSQKLPWCIHPSLKRAQVVEGRKSHAAVSFSPGLPSEFSSGENKTAPGSPSLFLRQSSLFSESETFVRSPAASASGPLQQEGHGETLHLRILCQKLNKIQGNTLQKSLKDLRNGKKSEQYVLGKVQGVCLEKKCEPILGVSHSTLLKLWRPATPKNGSAVLIPASQEKHWKKQVTGSGEGNCCMGTGSRFTLF